MTSHDSQGHSVAAEWPWDSNEAPVDGSAQVPRVPTAEEVAGFLRAVKEADECVLGDSNDEEIDILRDCVELALRMLGLDRLPVVR